MRIDGPVEVAKAAHPFEEFLAGLPLHSLRGPVDHGDADALLHHGVELLQLGVQDMTAMTRAEDDDGGGSLEYALVLRVTVVGNQHGLHGQPTLVEPVRKDHVAGSVFMGHPAVTGLARDENDLRLLRRKT